MQRRNFIALLAALPWLRRLGVPVEASERMRPEIVHIGDDGYPYSPEAVPPAAIGFLYGDSDYEDFDFSDGHAYAIRHEFWNATHGDKTRH